MFFQIGIIAILIVSILPMSYSYNIFTSNPSSFNKHHLAATTIMSLYTVARLLAEFYSNPVTVHLLITFFHLMRFMLYPILLLNIMDFTEVFLVEKHKYWAKGKRIKAFLPAIIYIVTVFVYFSILNSHIMFDSKSYNIPHTGTIMDSLKFIYWGYYFFWLIYILIDLLRKVKTKFLKKIIIIINTMHLIMFLAYMLTLIFVKETATFNIVLGIEVFLMIPYSIVGNRAFLLQKPSYQLFEVFDKTEQAVAISNSRFEIIYGNKTCYDLIFYNLISEDKDTMKILKFSENSLVGKNIDDLLQNIKDNSDNTSLTLDNIYIDFAKTIRITPDNNNIRYVYVTNSTSYNDKFQYTGSTFFIRDITEYAKDRVSLQSTIKELNSFIRLNNEKNFALEERLVREMAMYNKREKIYKSSRDTDSITGLLKKDALDRNLLELVDNKVKQFALITLKIRNYKSFANTKGHRFMNKLLKTLTLIIKDNLSDTDLISRDNSDTFYIATTRYVSEENLIEKIQLLQSDMKRYRVIDSIEVSILSNCGISRYPDDGRIVKELIANSETAMYIAEENAKDIVLFTKDLQDEILRDRRLDMEIKEGARNKEFIPFLQPVVKYVDGQKSIASYEALVRWHKKGEDKPVSPYFFINLAEKTGTVKDITENVLEYTAQYINELKNKCNDFKISVNLSAKELKDPLFIQKVQKTIDHYEINTKNIEFEITERWLIDDVAFATQILKRLRLMGFTISIDDFGQENSSLTYLKTLPITKLKIDSAYVRQIPKPLEEGEVLSEKEKEERKKSTLILKTIIQLAKDLNLEVLAEGVEYDYELEFLNREGCHLIQGYYFYKPMPFDEIIEKEIY